MYTYNSSAERNSGARANPKKHVSQLAQASFDAFEPFITVFDPGLKLSDGQIIHTITKDDWKLYRRHKAGERPRYEDGTSILTVLGIDSRRSLPNSNLPGASDDFSLTLYK